MPFRILWTEEARAAKEELAKTDVKKHKKVCKTAGHLERNPKHPGLQTHKYRSLKGPNGEDVWESYVEQHTPGAYRMFWYYGPNQGDITILAVTPTPSSVSAREPPILVGGGSASVPSVSTTSGSDLVSD